MTTTPFPPHTPQPDGRTVRDIALHTPSLVNEVWCRKILRQVLQSLDAQYANGAAHRLIMPDTIVMQASGDAVLLPDPDAIPDFQPEIGADLRALAAVIHFAITQEMPARGPLVGRGLEGYSDSLLGAIDRCMSSNKTQRPQTVAELRDLLGMVSVGLLKPSASAAFAGPAASATATAPAPAPAAPPETRPLVHKTVDLGPPASPRKWLWIVLAAVLLAAVLYIVRQHGAEALVGAPAPAPKAAEPAPAPLPAPVTPPTPPDTPPAAPEAPSTPAPAESAKPAAQAAAAVPTTASYRLMIKPWGTVYVDGQRRGVSPPLKRITVPPGRHTVMVENPGYPDRIVQINSARGASGQIAHDFLANQPETAEPAN